MGVFFFVLLVVMKVVFCLAAFTLLVYGFESRCNGFVRDGLSEDIDIQSSTSAITASWSFPAEKILRYEWAVVSSSMVPVEFALNPCREQQGFRGHPNVSGWHNAGTSTSVNAQARLVDGQKYFVIIRATNSEGIQYYANSDGFIVDSTFIETPKVVKTEQRVAPEEKEQQRNIADLAGECPIDQANRCVAGSVSVREKLNEFYGPPRYGFTQPAGFQPEEIVTAGDDDDSDDDNDEIRGGGAFGIGVAITVFFLLLAIGAMIIAAMGSQGGSGGGVRERPADEF